METKDPHRVGTKLIYNKATPSTSPPEAPRPGPRPQLPQRYAPTWCKTQMLYARTKPVNFVFHFCCLKKHQVQPAEYSAVKWGNPVVHRPVLSLIYVPLLRGRGGIPTQSRWEKPSWGKGQEERGSHTWLLLDIHEHFLILYFLLLLFQQASLCHLYYTEQ